MSIELAGYALQ